MKRFAARVIVVDDDGRVLLFRGGDPRRPEAGTWWFTPGGGVERGETLLDTACRELREETGLVIDPADLPRPIYLRETEFEFDGETYEQRETFFWVVVPPFEIDTSGWTIVERASMTQSRWWTLGELKTTDQLVYPENLTDLLTDILEIY